MAYQNDFASSQPEDKYYLYVIIVCITVLQNEL